MTFDTIRAFSIRPGDQLPALRPSGTWDKSRVTQVASVHSSAGMVVLTMTDGSTVRAFPMNRVPFKRAA